MRKLKEKVEELVRIKEKLIGRSEMLAEALLDVQAENTALQAQADKVGPLISENVNLTNKLEDLQNEVEQLTDSL